MYCLLKKKYGCGKPFLAMTVKALILQKRDNRNGPETFSAIEEGTQKWLKVVTKELALIALDNYAPMKRKTIRRYVRTFVPLLILLFNIISMPLLMINSSPYGARYQAFSRQRLGVLAVSTKNLIWRVYWP